MYFNFIGSLDSYSFGIVVCIHIAFAFVFLYHNSMIQLKLQNVTRGYKQLAVTNIDISIFNVPNNIISCRHGNKVNVMVIRLLVWFHAVMISKTFNKGLYVRQRSDWFLQPHPHSPRYKYDNLGRQQLQKCNNC